MLTLVCIVIYLYVIALFCLQRTDLRLLIFFIQTHWLWYALKFISAILRSVFVDLFLSLQIHCQRSQYRSGILLPFWLGYQTKSPSSDLGVIQIWFLMARSDYFPFWNFCFNEDMILVFESNFGGFVHLHDLHTWGWNSSFINQSGVLDYYLHSMNFVFFLKIYVLHNLRFGICKFCCNSCTHPSLKPLSSTASDETDHHARGGLIKRGSSTQLPAVFVTDRHSFWKKEQ